MKDNTQKTLNLLKGDSAEKRLERKIINIKSKDSNTAKNRSTFNDIGFLTELSEKINETISNNESLFEILPDVELAMSFLISAILSPKDLMSCKLNFTLKNLDLDKEIIIGVTKILETFFTQKYSLDALLPTILKEVLFEKGSYPLLILPESEVDKIINTDCKISKESYNKIFNKSFGLLSKNDKIYDSLKVTDNFDVLKKPVINEVLRTQAIDEIFSNKTAFESRKPNIFKRKYDVLPVSIIETDSEKLIGEPTVIKLSTECIIPVHTPGDPSKHIAYFILLDSNGYPVNGQRDRKTFEQLQGRLTTESNEDLKELIRQTKMAIYGSNLYNNRSNEFNVEIYTKMIERELMKKLEGGLYKDNVEISELENISKIMLARALSQKQSILLFVPQRIVTYIAFNYNENGIGKSLLENTRILSSLRSILMFANVIASIKNSVPRTGVKITLDEADPNPRETVEFLLNEFAKNHNQSFPIGITNPADIVDAIQRSSIDVAVSGNTAYPETNIDITDKTRSVAKPDQELENQLRRRQYMAFGLPPEIIDADMNVEFATTILAANSMVAKKVSIYQNLLCEKINDLIRKYILASSSLSDEIISKIGKNKKKEKQSEAFNKILDSIFVTLPELDSTKIESQVNMFDTYTAGLEKILTAYISPEHLSRLLPTELEDAIEPTMQCIKAYYQRMWLQNNNVYSELTSLVDIDDPESSLRMDLIEENHIDALLKTIGKLMTKVKKTGDAMMVKIQGQGEEEQSGGDENEYSEQTPEEETESEEVEEETTPEDTEIELPEEETEEETEIGDIEEPPETT